MVYTVQGMSKEQFYNVTKQCFEDMRDAGITTVGEFHYFHHETQENKFGFDQVVLQAAQDVGENIHFELNKGL